MWDEDWCYAVLRKHRWPHGVVCARCGGTRVTVHTRLPDVPQLRYFCPACRSTFTDRTGTVFARSKVRLNKWFAVISGFSAGLSSRECAQELSVKWDTARRMIVAIRAEIDRPGLVKDLRDFLAREATGRAGRGTE